MTNARGRAVFGVNAAVSVALVVLVAAVALAVNPPSPPGIAAFAPAATKPITKAPPGQAAASGIGPGICPTGVVCARPRASASPPVPSGRHGSRNSDATALATPSTAAGVPSALQCFSWPDGSVTQTFDPQSPPCVASWPGQANGNGGSTSTGVTATEIRIAYPVASKSSTLSAIAPIVDFLNTHFELYGRKIILVPFPSQTFATGDNENPSAQKADAEQVSTLHTFGAVDFTDGGNPFAAPLPEYVDTLADAKVVSLTGGEFSTITSSGHAQQHAPYEWSYLPSVADLMQQVATMTCAQLAHGTASHSSATAGQPRKFAFVLPDSSIYGESVPGLAAAEAVLASCGITSPPVVLYNGSQNQSAEAADFLKLKQDGVTSLIYLPEAGSSPMTTAATVNYDPEWVIVGTNDELTANLAAEPASETQDSFGIVAFNKVSPIALMPWDQAFAAAGGSPSVATSLPGGDGIYHELLLLASGAQLAGPHLTPATFAAALTSATFPNPGAAHAPSYQGTVGFPEAGDSMVRDVAGFWLDPSANEASAVSEGLKEDGHDWQSFCWDQLGVRWSDGSWPRDDTFREGGCPR